MFDVAYATSEYGLAFLNRRGKNVHNAKQEVHKCFVCQCLYEYP